MTRIVSTAVSPRLAVALEDVEDVSERQDPPTRVRLSMSVPPSIRARADLAPDIPRAVETLRIPFTVR